MSSYYQQLSGKSVMPITISTSKKKNKWSWFSSSEKVKPVTANTLTPEQDFYSKTGIIYSGSIEGSVINSLF